MRKRSKLFFLLLSLFLAPTACQTAQDSGAAAHPPAAPCGHCPTLSEWKAFINAGNFAIVSAGRNSSDPADQSLDSRAIEDRHRNLAKELTGFRLAFYEGEGHYEGHWETVYILRLPSSFDANILRDLGRRYHQQSIIIARDGEQALIYTSGPDVGHAYRGKGWREVKARSGDFTELQSADGKLLRFRLNFDFSNSAPYE